MCVFELKSLNFILEKNIFLEHKIFKMQFLDQ